MNFNFILGTLFITTITFYIPFLNAQTPVPIAGVVGDTLPYNSTALWNQMYNPGTNSVTSQNFESIYDNYDSFAAEQFGLMDDIWSVTTVEVRGAYFGGSGIAESVNVWFYSDSAGLPNQVIHSSLNVIPTNGLSTGSFSIPLSSPVELVEGMYWVCVQANMNFNSSGQWGWTTSANYFINESVWKNPGNGFGNVCTNYNYRASNCGLGTAPGLCFALIGDIVPVELASFTAVLQNDDVILNWITASEINNSGFQIDRSKIQDAISENWMSIGFVEGNGTTTEPSEYNFTDNNVTSGKYVYRLKQIDYDGTLEYSNLVEVEISAPTKLSLEQNYPNPFNPSTTIRYTIPLDERRETKNVTLKIYDVLGNEIAILVDEEKAPGNYEVEFQSTVVSHQLASGIYYYQLKSGEFIQSKKMILMK